MEFSDLKFVSINNSGTSPEVIDMLFRQIPKELFEQVKDIEFNIDLLYKMPAICINNISMRFYVLINSDDKIKGILWASINILTEKIEVHILSIDKEYQFSNALEKTLEFIRSWQVENKNLKIQIITTRPHAYEKQGWEQSKRKIMEINNE